MSTEDDLELRDLLVQTLEKNGTLAKLRAQLRANIFLALDEQEKVKNKSPLLNENVQKFASNDEGRLCLDLVVDLLKCLKMDCSETVFIPESGLTYKKSRDILASNLEISINNDSERNQPLLYILLNRFKNSAMDNNFSAKGDYVSKEKVINGPTSASINEEFKPATEVDDDFFNEAPPPLNYSLSSSVTQRQKISSKSGPLDAEISGRKNLTNVSPADGAINLSSASSFLGDLPELPRKTPLQSSSLPPMGGAEDKKSTNNQRDLNLKKLIGESFDEISGESDSSLKSSKSSSEKRKLKNDQTSKTTAAKKDAVQEQGGEKSKNSYLFNPRGDSKNGGLSVDDDVSEEIVEDLEIDDLLNSSRSPHQISF